ncbi:MAG TPA: regulator of amino acid metabolism, contains ACT domain protein [Methanomassiliicoccales archaeon]|nr:regulator of amino acid metabolism, contains ACT domain protein [Methanomassiliicoccales archaeon]
MWKQISNYFGRYPSQAKVAKLLLDQGLRVHEGRIYSGDVELGDVAIGKAANVDRRIVRAAVDTIQSSAELMRVFSKLRPISFLKDVASEMGWSAIEIIPTNAATPGIVADVTGVIASSGISIRQAIVSDPDLSTEPRLFIITESPVPPELIPRLKTCRGVKSILIH